MQEKLDPFRLRKFFDLYNFVKQELGDPGEDLRILRNMRRALLTTPFDGPRHDDTNIFPPLEKEPHPLLAGKRVGLVLSGGSGSLVTLCGVKRALEEAEIEVAAVSACSGGAIWGSMVAAGWSAQQMVDESLRWMPADVIDMDWAAIARAPWTLLRGFTGLVRGEAIERTLDRAFGGVTLGETPIPYYAIVLDIDNNKLDYFGPHTHPEVKLASMVRVAIALPLFVAPVRFGEHLYVDGGVVNIFPVDGLLEQEAPFDYFIGVNTIMPPRFESGEDISGWETRPMGILEVSRQLWHTQHIELARQQLDKIRDRTLLLEPLPWDEIAGARFFDIIVDNANWPAHILTAYHDTKAKLRTISELPS
jgi:NTE family protein